MDQGFEGFCPADIFVIPKEYYFRPFWPVSFNLWLCSSVFGRWEPNHLRCERDQALFILVPVVVFVVYNFWVGGGSLGCDLQTYLILSTLKAQQCTRRSRKKNPVLIKTSV